MYNFKNILINNYELFEFLEYHDKKNEIFEKYVNKDNIVINIMNKQNKDILNIDKYLSFIKNKRYCYFIYLYNYDSNPLSYDLEMFNDNKYIRKVLYNISYNLKTINNIEIFYENIYILDYFVNLIEHKKNMVKMKLYIFLEFIIIFLFNEEFDFVFIFLGILVFSAVILL